MARNYPTGANQIKAFKRNPHYFTDYFGQNTNSGNAYQLTYAPLTLFTAATTGTMLAHTSAIPSNAASPKHPGTATMQTNAANTESGGSLQTGEATIILGTAITSFTLIFLVHSGFTVPASNGISRFGFQTTADSTTNSNTGAYFIINRTFVLSGNTRNSGGSTSATPTTYTISTNTWYRAYMEINADNSRVDFYLYNDYGNLLWSNNLTTTMPNAAVRAGVACRGTNASATPIMTFDYTSIAFSGLVR